MSIKDSYLDRSDMTLALLDARLKSMVAKHAPDSNEGDAMLEMSTEGFGFFTSMADLVGRVFNNFTSNLMHIGSDLRRSELRSYCGSHRASVDKLFSMTPASMNIRNRVLPTPDGLKVSYKEACTNLHDAAQNLNIEQALSSAEHVATLMSTAVEHLKDAKSTQEDVNDIDLALAGLTITDRKVVEANLQDTFSSDKFRPMNGAQLFGDIRGLKDVVDSCLSFESIYREALEAQTRVQKLNSSMDRVITRMEGEKALPVNLVKALQAFVSSIAWHVDLFGVTVSECQRVEHNVTLCVRELVMTA